MKRILKSFLTLILLLVFFIIVKPGLADGPPPPPPGGGHGASGNQPPGGGVPVGEGAALLVLMAAGYGIERVIKLKRKYKIENEQGHMFN